MGCDKHHERGTGRVGQSRTLQYCSSSPCLADQGPAGLSTSEKEVTHNAVRSLTFSLSAGCVLIYAFNKHPFASTLSQAQGQVLKVGEEGQSPHASCPPGFTDRLMTGWAEGEAENGGCSGKTS